MSNTKANFRKFHRDTKKEKKDNPAMKLQASNGLKLFKRMYEFVAISNKSKELTNVNSNRPTYFFHLKEIFTGELNQRLIQG